MVIIELNKVRPLDVLLTSADEKFSKAIRLASTAARGGRKAEFSHAALFISPTLIVEALYKEGIVFSNLIEPGASSQTAREHALAGKRFLFPRLDEGKLRLFVSLEGESSAVVLRHKQTKSLETFRLTMPLRWTVFEVLMQCYLAQYPGFGRLLRTLPNIPPKILDATERYSNLRQKKVLPGPFCSELVTILFAALGLFVSRTSPEETSPSDLAASDNFDRIDDAIIGGSVADLPGDPCPKDFSSRLERMLTSEALRHQEMQSKILQLGALAPQAMAAVQAAESGDWSQEPSAEWEKYYTELRDQSREKWLKGVEDFLQNGCDPLWQWVEEANECIESCPEGRKRREDVVNPPPEGRVPLFLGPSWKAPRYWDGTACKDVRGCVCASKSWARVDRQFDEAQELAQKLREDSLKENE